MTQLGTPAALGVEALISQLAYSELPSQALSTLSKSRRTPSMHSFALFQDPYMCCLLNTSFFVWGEAQRTLLAIYAQVDDAQNQCEPPQDWHASPMIPQAGVQ